MKTGKKHVKKACTQIFFLKHKSSSLLQKKQKCFKNNRDYADLSIFLFIANDLLAKIPTASLIEQ